MNDSASAPYSSNGFTIAMVVDNEYYGDARVQNEAFILARNGFRVKIVCFTFGKFPEYEIKNGIEIHRIKISRRLKNFLFGIVNTFPFYNLFWASKLLNILPRLGANAVHAHDLYMLKPARAAASRLKLPLIIDLHENYPEAVKGYRWANTLPYSIMANPDKWKHVEKKYLHQADGIVVLSKHFAEYIHQKYLSIEEEKFWVYPNVPDIDEMDGYSIRKTNLNPNDHFNILYFGGISQRRGIYTCIQSLGELTKEYSNIKLILIGPVDGHERADFETAISQKDIKDSIMHIPWIDISELPSYINDSHVCISPIVKNAQHDSGVANKVFQYMLMGKPVIVSNCIPQSQLIAEGKSGLVFESENAQDLSEKIIQLYGNKDLREEMGSNGRKLVLAKYNTKYFGDSLVRSYRNLLNTWHQQNKFETVNISDK